MRLKDTMHFLRETLSAPRENTASIQVAGLTVFENEGAYNIWDTDYDTYTLIYSCKEISKNIFWKGKNGIELKNIKFRFFIF